MTRRIQILPDNLINQIAAGEVVERPASVVKELVENALDAGAGRIEIMVRNGGKTEIRVADDGCGMGREDVMLSLDRHATSKIRDVHDLAAIHTLGFRGEALPSIASVSRLTIETAEQDGAGTRVAVSGGRISGVEECARRRGTTVAVRTLFFNVPARAKFLRSVAAETRAVAEIVTSLALAYPQVGYSLESNGRSLLDLPPTPDLQRRIADIWGEEAAAELIPVAHRDGDVTLTGLVQRPRDATPGGRRAYLFVDRRPFRDRALVRAADRGYRTTIAAGIHPSIFLFLDVPETTVDVNVHPTKAEVRFRDAIGVEKTVEEGVRAALARLESAAHLGRSPAPESPDRPSRSAVLREQGGQAGTGAAPDGTAESQMSLFMAAASGPAESDTGAPGAAEPEIHMIRPLIWQVHNTYLLAETRSGLIIIDQHSAHERVLYEELVRGFSNGGRAAGQRLLFPLTLQLSPAEFTVVEELSGLLTRAGFEIEPFGGRSIIVHAVPNPHAYFDAERCLREMIAELTHGSTLVDTAHTQHQRIALSFACKAAIKAGQRLAPEEMAELFDRLFATELPYHDIHGRPTIVQLPLSELHTRFGRHG